MAGLSVVAKYESIKTKDWPMTGEKTLLLSSLYKMDMMEFWEGEILFLSLFLFSLGIESQQQIVCNDVRCFLLPTLLQISLVDSITVALGFFTCLGFYSENGWFFLVSGKWRLDFSSFSDWFYNQDLSFIIRGGLSFSFITVAPVVRAHHCSS